MSTRSSPKRRTRSRCSWCHGFRLSRPARPSRVRASLEDRCSALFRDHRVEAFDGTFHVPNRESYPALFAWDSGYHALSLLHLDPAAAFDELTTLYRANRLPDGLLSHQRYVPGAEDHQQFIEDLFGPMFDGDRTPFVDPPTPAYAAARLSLALGAPADHLLDEAVSHLRALARSPNAGRPVASRRLAPVRDRDRGERPHAESVSRWRRRILCPLQGPHLFLPRRRHGTSGGRGRGPRIRGVRADDVRLVLAGARGGGRCVQGPGPSGRGSGGRTRSRGGGQGSRVVAVVGRRTHLRRVRRLPISTAPGHGGHGPASRCESHCDGNGPVGTGRRTSPPS